MPDNDDIASYIAQNRDRYTRDAIRAELIRQGHDAEAVDAALAAHAAGTDTTVDVRGRALAITFIGYVAAVLLVSARYAGTGTYAPANIGAAIPFALLFFSPAFVISMLAILIVNRKRVRPADVANAMVAGLFLPVVLLLAMTGICLSFGR